MDLGVIQPLWASFASLKIDNEISLHGVILRLKYLTCSLCNKYIHASFLFFKNVCERKKSIQLEQRSFFWNWLFILLCLFNTSNGKESACKAEDQGSIPGLGVPLEKGMAIYSSSCLENFIDREPWWATVHGVASVRHNWATNTHTHKKPALMHVFLVSENQMKTELARY